MSVEPCFIVPPNEDVDQECDHPLVSTSFDDVNRVSILVPMALQHGANASTIFTTHILMFQCHELMLWLPDWILSQSANAFVATVMSIQYKFSSQLTAIHCFMFVYKSAPRFRKDHTCQVLFVTQAESPSRSCTML